MLGSKRPERASQGTWFEVRAICDEGAAAGADRLVRAARAEGYRAFGGENGHGEDVAVVLIPSPADGREVVRLVNACDMSATYQRS
jgi:hypothetical protein